VDEYGSISEQTQAIELEQLLAASLVSTFCSMKNERLVGRRIEITLRELRIESK
jgi:hypothetical protein